MPKILPGRGSVLGDPVVPARGCSAITVPVCGRLDGVHKRSFDDFIRAGQNESVFGEVPAKHPPLTGAPADPTAHGKKKPAWPNTQEVFDHAGLLVNGPPGIHRVAP